MLCDDKIDSSRYQSILLMPSNLPAAAAEMDEPTVVDRYHIGDDISADEVERILEHAEGRCVIDGRVVSRYIPKCVGMAVAAAYLERRLVSDDAPFLDAAGTMGIMFSNGSLRSPDWCLFDKHRMLYERSHQQKQHMLQVGAIPRWCLQIDWLEDLHHPGTGGFAKVAELFSLRGDNNEQIEEVWLMSCPRDCKDLHEDDKPLDALPVIQIVAQAPASGCFIAIYKRSLEAAMGVTHADPHSLLVGYYELTPGHRLQVPVFSLLHGHQEGQGICVAELLACIYSYTVPAV